MKSVAFWNRKGGTGKTTTAGNVAAELRRHGRTLLVDGDPQSNLTSWYVKDGAKHELADVLAGGCELASAVVNVRENLDLLPSFAIGGDLKGFSETQLPKQPFVFLDLRETIEKAGYRYTVYDLAPGDSSLERAILGTVDLVVLVAAPEFFSRDGLEAAEATLDEVRKQLRGRFDAGRLVVNRLNAAYAAHRVIEEELASSTKYRRYLIGQSTAIHDSQMVHQSLFEYEPGNRYMAEYQRLAQEITQ